MRPRPTTPRRLPWSSVPANDLRSHLPAFIEASAAGMWRATERSSERASSAVDTRLPPGEFITITPRRAAAAARTLSPPPPGRAITRGALAAARTPAAVWPALPMVDARGGVAAIAALAAGTDV